ncbi:TetR/AcrR family transcriptional regulator [Holdemania filiformis]|uniref:TetR/AcrR family transcriptional regulator n=1 Tax=Holdemania filiformis TaxID=61171 RepID=UPI002674BBC4|nr:TetR/AcrR family transcriptional regulator [Holdemania filiformis]
MARNKHPEQTFEKIVVTAARLFVEKGYEQTSVQDILDATGLSKGGLYHHFKSKEQILDAVMQRRIQYVNKRFQELIRNTPGKNAKEKLKKILGQLAADAETHALDQALASQLDPHFVVNGIQTCVGQDAPIVAGLIREGNRDGSLHVQQPELCAEVFLMLLNYWANPVLFHRNSEETEIRLRYLQSVMIQLGLDLIDDSLITDLIQAYVQ